MYRITPTPTTPQGGSRERYAGTEFGPSNLVDKEKVDIVVSRWGGGRRGGEGRAGAGAGGCRPVRSRTEYR